jgi:hypothetical protein
MQIYVTGLFSDEVRAAAGVRELVDAHFSPTDQPRRSVGARGGVRPGRARHGRSRRRHRRRGARRRARRGRAALVAVGTLPAPVALFAAGPVLAALQGGALGAAAGGLLGSLAGLGSGRPMPGSRAALRGRGAGGVRTSRAASVSRAPLTRAGANPIHVALSASLDAR